MRWYRCFIRGENFPMRLKPDEEITLCGFYTTRWVEANSPQAAEAAALALMRADDTFAPPDGYQASVTAKVHFEKIEEAQGPQTQGGATWFRMDEA